MLRLHCCGCPSSQPVNIVDLRCPPTTPTNVLRNCYSYQRCENMGITLHSHRSHLNLTSPRHWRRDASFLKQSLNKWACIVLLVVTIILGLSQLNSYIQFPPLVPCIPLPISSNLKPVSSVQAPQVEATAERVSPRCIVHLRHLLHDQPL